MDGPPRSGAGGASSSSNSFENRPQIIRMTSARPKTLEPCDFMSRRWFWTSNHVHLHSQFERERQIELVDIAAYEYFFRRGTYTTHDARQGVVISAAAWIHRPFEARQRDFFGNAGK